MPNHCYQSVYLAGNPKEIDRLYEAVKEQKFLNAVIPEPSTMFHGASVGCPKTIRKGRFINA